MRSAHAFCAGPAALSGYVPVMEIPRAPVSPLHAAMADARRALGQRDPAAALMAFDDALILAPTLALAHLGRAICLLQLEREAEADAALEATLETSNGQEQVLYHMARMIAKEGHASFAIPLLVEAVRALPTLIESAVQEPLFRDHPVFLAAVGRI